MQGITNIVREALEKYDEGATDGVEWISQISLKSHDSIRFAVKRGNSDEIDFFVLKITEG